MYFYTQQENTLFQEDYQACGDRTVYKPKANIWNILLFICEKEKDRSWRLSQSEGCERKLKPKEIFKIYLKHSNYVILESRQNPNLLLVSKIDGFIFFFISLPTP